jgi:hypothetical protein
MNAMHSYAGCIDVTLVWAVVHILKPLVPFFLAYFPKMKVGL